MIDWLKSFSLIEFQKEERHTFPRGQFEIKKMDAVNNTADMTAMGQYFAAATVWLSEHVMIELPAQDEDAKRLILDEVAPHFANVQQVKTDGLEAIRMQGLKPTSKDLFQQTVTEALPIVKDLYRYQGINKQHHQGGRTILLYPVDTGKLEPFEPDELQRLRTLLSKAFIEPDKEFNIMPLGWSFDSSLRESIALRFYGSFVPSVTLYVDGDTQEVVLIRLAGRDVKHPVILRQEEPGHTRIAESFLYLYLSGGLVYVIDLRDQATIEKWDDLKSCRLFQLEADMRFSEFDHTSGSKVKEGVGLIFDQDSTRTMMETVNRHIRE